MLFSASVHSCLQAYKTSTKTAAYSTSSFSIFLLRGTACRCVEALNLWASSTKVYVPGNDSPGKKFKITLWQPRKPSRAKSTTLPYAQKKVSTNSISGSVAPPSYFSIVSPRLSQPHSFSFLSLPPTFLGIITAFKLKTEPHLQTSRAVPSKTRSSRKQSVAFQKVESRRGLPISSGRLPGNISSMRRGNWCCKQLTM